MRTLLGLLFLALFLLVAGLLLQWSKGVEDRGLAESWALSLAWKSLQLTNQPLLSSVKATRRPDGKAAWKVSGTLTIADDALAGRALAMVADLQVLCGNLRSEDCWRLQGLELEGQQVVRNGALEMEQLQEALGLEPALLPAPLPAPADLPGPAEAPAESDRAMPLAEDGEATAEQTGQTAAAEQTDQTAAAEDSQVASGEAPSIERMDGATSEGLPLPRRRP